MTPRLARHDAPLAAAITLVAALAMVVLIGPVIVVVISSFSASATLAFPPPGLTLRWYAELLDPVRSQVLQAAALNSVLVACGATVLATLVATSAALAISRSRARWARAAEACFMAPLVLPGIAFGLAMLMFVSWLGLGSSLSTMMLGSIGAHGRSRVVGCFFLSGSDCPNAAQTQRRPPSPHPEDGVQGAELAGL